MTFDLEKVREANHDYLDLQYQLDSAEAEIERLRAALDKSEQILAHKTKTSTHWYEEGLQTSADLVQCKRVVEQQAARIEELGADLEQSEICIRARLDVIDQQAAKIRELEDVHKRSGVKYAKIINELRSSVYANIPGLKKQWDEILNAPANGKIGPDADAKPQVWQITEERKAALWHAIKVLKENDIMEEPEEHLWDEEVTILQAMLTEAE